MAADRYLEPEWDDDLPPVPDLQGLAGYAETRAIPAAPTAVRRAGTARRRRRHVGMVAGALAVLVAAGGIAVGGTRSLTDPPPVVAASPTPTSRTVTEANLLRPDDISDEGNPVRLEAFPDQIRRHPDRLSPCLPDNWEQTLAPTATLERRYGYLTEESTADNPSYYDPKFQAVALQFSDEDSAKAAEVTLSGWLDGCPRRLRELGFTQVNPRLATRWYDVTANGQQFGRFAVIPPYHDAENYYGQWESLGLARVGDRVMITERLVEGDDDNVGVDPQTDRANGMSTIAQFSMIEAAAQRLRA